MERSNNKRSRRQFLQQLSGTTILLTANGLSSYASATGTESRMLYAEKKIAPSDKLQIACIGMGIMGFNDVKTAVKVPGIQLVAACDLYTGRLQRAKEVYGKDLFTTRDYRAILDRKDIDAVLIATSDNWHARIATEALQKGKSVYGEKPVVHQLQEGLPLIAAWQESRKMMQVGSQRVSNIAYSRARELYKAGEIGQLTCIEASFDRQSALGAWEYTQPTDGSPQTVDWDRYIAGTPQQAYDPKKFFWWRNYRAFGTGVAGDLFVHLLSGIHLITGSKGPEKIYSTGQTAYWKDGRDVPDVMTAIMHYPESPEHAAFEVTLRVNFISGEGDVGTVKFVGSEGVLEMGYNGFTIRHHKMSVAPGIGGWDALDTYPQVMQDELKRQYDKRYTKEQQQSSSQGPTVYQLPEGYDEHLDHFTNFFTSIRTGSPIVENPVFGFRAAAPCLAANDSYFQNKVIHWDPVNMKLQA